MVCLGKEVKAARRGRPGGLTEVLLIKTGGFGCWGSGQVGNGLDGCSFRSTKAHFGLL